MSNDKKPDFSNVQGGVQSTEQIKPDFSNVGIWEWDNRGGGFPCVAAPGWRDYADRWANDTCHLVMQLPVVLREVP